ncbi:centrosomal protein of 44 kda [Stylonychia lemnae]|uniref:Centrosomal protein of 44 kDa n=1 Tax=Stylonychia lemnae TaxID=5949 RepID=A0A077ZTD3_STYLE|nr:centrosomal protein of 44 kda [Stylonychia lemnae]|eukprot:CDW71721.1 centrosomal protein of 44 kda [Stylonychia lemnae]
MRFMESVYKLLLNQFNYKPAITIQQFFQNGFSERKVIFACEVIDFMKQKHQVLSKMNQISQNKPVIKPKKQQKTQEALQLPDSQFIGQQNVMVIKHEPPPSMVQNQYGNGIIQSLHPFADDEKENSDFSIPSPMSNQSPNQSVQQNYISAKQKKLPKSFAQRKASLHENQTIQNQNHQQDQNMYHVKNSMHQQQISYPQQQQQPFQVSPIFQTQQTFDMNMQNQTQDKQSELTKDLMKLIVNVNESIKTLGSRFESFQTSIEDKVNKLQAEQILIKNRLQIIEKNTMGRDFALNNNNNMIAFDFNNHQTQEKANLSQMLEIQNNTINTRIDQQQLQAFPFQISQNILSNSNVVNQNLNNNSLSYNSNETEDYIKQVASRFEETRKLLNEGKSYKY